MQGLGFAILGALERLLGTGVFADNPHPPRYDRSFYEAMFADYRALSIHEFSAKYGSNWYDVHGRNLRRFIATDNTTRGSRER